MGKESDKTQIPALLRSKSPHITSHITHHTSQARAQKDINKRTSQEPSEFPDHSLARSNLPNSKITTRPGHASCTLPSPLPHCLPLMLTHTIRPHAPHVPPPLHLSLSSLLFPAETNSSFTLVPSKSNEKLRAKQNKSHSPNNTKKSKRKKRREKKLRAQMFYQDKTYSSQKAMSRKQKIRHTHNSASNKRRCQSSLPAVAAVPWIQRRPCVTVYCAVPLYPKREGCA